jgi:xanthine dehydrogenase YagR molybdenum-binding subunit
MTTVAPQSVGRAVDRIDGPAKVTGQAHYTADNPRTGLAFAVLVTSNIAHGRIAGIAARAAEAAPGVAKVLTHLNMPRLAPIPPQMPMQKLMPMQGDRIEYEGQPVALVVAETLEQATHAAKLLRIDYEMEPAHVDFRDDLDQGRPVSTYAEADTHVGDVEASLARADVRIEHVYRTADRHHNTMEPSATIAEWRGRKLEMVDATQWVWGVRMTLAAAFGIAPEDVHVRNEFCGGGFGAKGYVWPHQILAAVAAREVGRPVKLVLTRAQAFTAHGYQPATEQTIALGATHQGELTAIRHDSVSPTATFEDYMEYAGSGTRLLYACPAIVTTHRAVRVHRGVPTPMRAPHEGPGMVALEIALDELAIELEIDPVELRIRNHTDKDPTTGKPFSSKKLIECYREGAERFGWSRRSPVPRSMRDGKDLVGWGMASAVMTTFRFPANARVTIDRDENVLIEAGCQEIGTGAHTVMPQIAADALGVPIDRVRLSLGDTKLPETGGTFGSSTTLGVGSAVHDAATKLKSKLLELAKRKGGELAETSYGKILAQSGKQKLSAEGHWSPGAEASPLGEAKDWSMASFGAVFAEVRVDEELPIPRVSRCVGVYSAGRIINPKTAKSQVIGGIVWGIGQALLEASEMDRVVGRYLSKNLAGYLLPVNADVGSVDVSFVDEVDLHASTIGARGIGELGAVGVGPAIANAVWHATGVRVREVPIRPEMLLAPDAG